MRNNPQKLCGTRQKVKNIVGTWRESHVLLVKMAWRYEKAMWNTLCSETGKMDIRYFSL